MPSETARREGKAESTLLMMPRPHLPFLCEGHDGRQTAGGDHRRRSTTTTTAPLSSSTTTSSTTTMDKKGMCVI
ncbi:unnamed protein product [Merluccius merluccius]